MTAIAVGKWRIDPKGQRALWLAMRRLLHLWLLIDVVLAAACAPLGRFGELSPPQPPAIAAPPTLASRLEAIGQSFDGVVGIAVHDIAAGTTAGFHGAAVLPQQSISKLWVALAVLDAADRGALSLADPVVVTKADLSVFNQPIRDRLGPDGYATTIGELLKDQIALSDNAANDILMRRVGGADAVQKLIADRKLGSIRGGPEETVLQSAIAGMPWRPEFSFGLAFWTARDLVAPTVRTAALDAYLADPPDGATANALAEALARLKRGELLSAASTARLLQIMADTTTGPMRLRAGLGEGWAIAHKTGTGQVMGELATGYNDVGLITAPDGRSYAVAVLIASTRRPVPERQAMMAEVARAVVAQHEAEARQPLSSARP